MKAAVLFESKKPMPIVELDQAEPKTQTQIKIEHKSWASTDGSETRMSKLEFEIKQLMLKTRIGIEAQNSQRTLDIGKQPSTCKL